MAVLFIILGLFALTTYLFMQQPSFGKKPSGARLERIKKSPQYKNGAFQNQSATPSFTGGANVFTVMRDVFWRKHERRVPDFVFPTVKEDLKVVPAASRPRITWFGHSSYLLQVNGVNILVDPVFSGRTSPVSYAGTKAFAGTDVYHIDDLPPVDIMVITHDHYDHLDYTTVVKLSGTVGTFIVPLGVGAHLEYWGVPSKKIKELDWWEGITVKNAIHFTATPARHFSGRGFKRNQTLWASFVLEAYPYNIYIGGDSGYDKHFSEIGEKFGPFDLAILENGQYNVHWANIHMMPEETVQAAIDLKAGYLLPVHWAKFSLSIHTWDEPIKRVTGKAKLLDIPVVTPRIGESIILDSVYPSAKWWDR